MRIEVRDLQESALPEGVVTEAARRAAAEVGFAPAGLSLVFVDDLRIEDLNRRFRGREGPTDVISFAADGGEEDPVGEVVVSVETAQRQAREFGRSLEAELAWLVAHGALHLSGMDDETEEQLEAMLLIQRRVLVGMGLEEQP